MYVYRTLSIEVFVSSYEVSSSPFPTTQHHPNSPLVSILLLRLVFYFSCKDVSSALVRWGAQAFLFPAVTLKI